MNGYHQIPRGQLWAALQQTTAGALTCAALQGIETDQAFVEEAGVRFLVRSVSSLRRKAEDRARPTPAVAGEVFNPFLPPEPPLTVGAIGPDHLAVLNKFNVLDHHLLIVTRRFEHQETLLTRGDFAALAWCLGEYDGLGFYNGGKVAGASQPHKHLQLVPLPLIPGQGELPVTPLFAGLNEGGLQQVAAFRFPHCFARLGPRDFADGERLRRRYLEMLDALGIGTMEIDGEARQTFAYNLLATRRWMLLAPRAAEFYEGVSVNALGFAGSLFVRNEAEMALVRERGPLAVLRWVVVGK